MAAPSTARSDKGGARVCGLTRQAARDICSQLSAASRSTAAFCDADNSSVYGTAPALLRLACLEHVGLGAVVVPQVVHAQQPVRPRRLLHLHQQQQTMVSLDGSSKAKA